MLLAGWITLGVLIGTLVALINSRWPPEAVLMTGVAVLLLTGVIDADVALSGMSNQGMATVAILYVIAAGLAQTGGVSLLTQPLLGTPKGIPTSQMRLMLPVAAISSLLNNTPVVAMMIPAISQWAKRHNVSVSQFMMPLSYAAIIGGCCTLVGTSTNLVINDMLEQHLGYSVLKLFDLAWIGIPLTLAVVAYVLAFSSWFLPNRKEPVRPFDDSRGYLVAMEIEAFSPMAGKTVAAAGLRQLPGLFLVEVQRRGQVMTAVSPNEMLYSGDLLLFAGDVEAVVELKRLRGLKVAEDQVSKLEGDHGARCLVEVVVSQRFPFLNKTIRDANFRNHYGAAIIAVAREAEIIKQRIGDIVLKAGDTLLLETDHNFVDRQKYRRDFLLVSEVEDSAPVRYEKTNVAFASLGLMLLLVMGLDWSMLKAAVVSGLVMLATGCLSMNDVRQAVKWDVLLVIAASLAMGQAVQVSGLAQVMGELTVSISGSSPWVALLAIFVVTAALSALISNLAAAVVIFPIMVAAAESLGVSIVPFAITLMIAASASFATPIGYQTNLMVYGPGDYRFMDFIRMGLPLTLLVGLLTVVLVPLIWPF